MVIRGLTVLVAGIMALLIGWLNPPSTELPVNAAQPLRLSVPTLGAPNKGALGAAHYLALLNPPPAPPPPPSTVKPPPSPAPPPDPSVVLQATVTAVVADPDGLHLVLAQTPGGPGRTVVHLGDTFQGWRIASIGRRQAILQRGSEQKLVQFFAPMPEVQKF